MKNIFSPHIDHLLEEGNEKGLTEALSDLSPFEIADVMTQKTDYEQSLIFNALPPTLKQHTFDYIPVWIQKNILRSMPATEAAALLSSLTPDDRTSFLQEIPREAVDELVKLLPYEERSLTLALLGYPEDSIGRLMTPDYIAVGMSWTIEEVLDHIQRFGPHCETIDFIYVVDDDQGVLLDEIQLKDLLFAPRQSKVSTLTDKKFLALSANDHDETAVNVFKEHHRIALPVVDDHGILLGIVTVDDILRLSNQEATEDIQKMGGMEALEEPYLQAPFLYLMQKRAGWLVLLFVGELLTASALSYFEDEISKAVVLALFLPLIVSSGGNAGSQATTLVIRAMSLGEIKLHDWWKILKLEISSGLFLGTMLGVLGFTRILVWNQFTNVYGEHSFLLGLTVGLAVLGVVLWCTVSGAVFPLILRRVGVDPATASAPFVATVVDVTGVVIYFLISIALLSGTLL